MLVGVFEDPNAALTCAKQIHIALFYRLMRSSFTIAREYNGRFWERALFYPESEPAIEGYDGNETYFFWNKRYKGGQIGPGVFEVAQSIDEFDDYQFISARITGYGSWELDLIDIDRHLFTYCREVQDYLDTILLAENARNRGLRMTIYCGLLEHISESEDKDPETLEMINQLIARVDESRLSPTSKGSLKGFLSSGRRVSSRQRCRNLVSADLI